MNLTQKITCLTLIASIFSLSAHAQKYITKNGHVWFYSEAPLENIEAHNYQVSSILEANTGKIVFSIPIKGFRFDKALMQQHFNKKYLHSDEYPKSKFKGKITNIDKLDLQQEGEHTARVAGDLMIHGVTRSKETKGTLTVTKDTILGQATFNVAVKAYNITIPNTVANNIADTVDVHVDLKYTKYN